MPQATISDINDFWIGAAARDPAAANDQKKRWYMSTSADDEAIRAQFGTTLQAAAAGKLDGWRSSPEGSQALVILLDQFSRNLFRGTAGAFANDPRARDITRGAIDTGQHLELSVIGRVFLYHPLHHSEDIADQDECVARYQTLLAEADPIWHNMLQDFLDYSIEHRQVVQQFGRFPHRNAVLGRTSTEAERVYLDAGARRYGQ